MGLPKMPVSAVGYIGEVPQLKPMRGSLLRATSLGNAPTTVIVRPDLPAFGRGTNEVLEEPDDPSVCRRVLLKR